ncbi:CPBP family intramembrane glutamic endopeptidase [Anaerobacillus sp. MEB173]|uniref:CPBP family intramembrane glutamic endopeptidase n=1 Tax=Anaerobacillus sp. MEB173 TaxID=3383345 RepID=UPI003F92923E
MNRSTLHALILAHFLLWISFSWQPITFWLIFSLSLFLLILYSIKQESMDTEGSWVSSISFGIGTGVGIYLLFAFGKWLIVTLQIPLLDQLTELYALVKPIETWHYIVLFLIIVPGEELFWRGFILKRLAMAWEPIPAILFASVLYASAHIYAGSTLLLIAALVAGTIWGALYLWKKNITLCIISHFVFNLLLLVIFPLL